MDADNTLSLIFSFLGRLMSILGDVLKIFFSVVGTSLSSVFVMFRKRGKL